MKATGAYLAGGAGYMAVPALLALAVSRPSLAGLADTFHPQSRERRFVLIAFLTPLLLPVVVAFASETDMNSIWMMAGFALLPVVLLSSPMISIGRRATQVVVMIAFAIPVVMTVAAPAIALAIHRTDRNETAMYGEMLAQRMLLEWRKASDRPLSIVGGDPDIAFVTAYYLRDAPASLPADEPTLAPWIDAARIARQGIVLTCRADANVQNGQACDYLYAEQGVQRILKDKSNVRKIEVELRRTFLGAAHSARFLIYVVPPAAAN